MTNGQRIGVKLCAWSDGHVEFSWLEAAMRFAVLNHSRKAKLNHVMDRIGRHGAV